LAELDGDVSFFDCCASDLSFAVSLSVVLGLSAFFSSPECWCCCLTLGSFHPSLDLEAEPALSRSRLQSGQR